MSHEFAMEFKEERFVNDAAGERVLSEFLSELFDELGFPNCECCDIALEYRYYKQKERAEEGET